MSIRRLAALVLIAAGMLSLSMSIWQGPPMFQYLMSPPAQKEPEQQETQPGQQEEGDQQEDEAPKEPQLTALEQLLKQLRERMGELSTAVERFGVTAYASGVSLTTSLGGAATAGLQGLWGDASLTQQYVLSSGRQLYHEELAQGAPFAVIDERLAIELFRVGDPVGRVFSLGAGTFQVVGVVRHSRHVGEKDPMLLQVPMLALDKQGFQPQVLSVNMLTKAGSGAYAALSKDMEQWQPGGSFHSLPKEQYRAMLPLRWLLCGLGLMIAAIALRGAKAFTLAQWRLMQDKLSSRYAVGLLPEMAGRGLMTVALYSGILLGIFLVLQEAIAPVYVFPEWVPTVLVEPKDIAKAFWGVREQESALISLASPALIRLRFLHRLMTALAATAGLLLIGPLGRLRQWLKSRLGA